MANQPSCRMNRPGSSVQGRSMSGSGRQMPGSSRSMPVPDCVSNGSRQMSGSGCSGTPSRAMSDCGSPRSMPNCGSSRPMQNMHRPGRPPMDASCSRNEVRPQTGAMMGSRRPDDRRSCDTQSAVTCINTADFPVGMTYVPMQTWGPLCDPPKALRQGTLFPELDKPFLGGRAAR